jgi:hypothetical protein
MPAAECLRHEEVLAELARGGAAHGGPGEQAALHHAASCGECSSRLAAGRALTASLDALAARTSQEQAGPEVEARLRAEWRFGRPEPVPAGDRWRGRRIAALALWSAAAAAAGVLVVRAPIGVPRDHATDARATPALASTPPSAEGTLSPERSAKAAPAEAPLAREDAESGPDGPAAAEGAAAVSAFVALRYDEEWDAFEGGQVLRVRLPRRALTSLGWPPGGEPAAVEADVLVGADGVARAIRVVQ